MNAIKPLFDNCSQKQEKNQIKPKILFNSSVIRVKLNVNLSDLNKYSINLKAKEQALNIILCFNQDDPDPEKIIDWGDKYQQSHITLLESILSLFNNPILLDVKRKFTGLIEDIQKLDLKDILVTGFFDKILNRKERFEKSFEQLKYKASEVSNTLPSLIKLKEEIDKLESDLLTLEQELEPYIIACAFFADYKKEGFPSAFFMGRLNSLTSTQLTIAQNKQQREIFENSILNLIDNIKNVLRTEIPMWYSNYLSILMNKNDQGIRDLDTQRQNILQKLQKSV